MVTIRTAGENDVFGGIAMVTAALPCPLAGVAPNPVAVQAEPGLVLAHEDTMLMVAWPPDAPTMRLGGLRLNVQLEGPNWLIVYCCPATVITEDRGLPVFA